MPFTLPVALTFKYTLLVGASKVAKQKHKVLADSGWSVQIVAKHIEDEYFSKFEVLQIELNDELLKSKTPINLSEFDTVIDASGDESLGEFLYKNRKIYGYLLNVVDKKEYCDFYFGSILRQENLSVMVSSSGASPILTQAIRDKIAKILPRNLSLSLPKLTNLRRAKMSESVKLKSKEICAKNLGKVFIIGCGTNTVSHLTLKAYETLPLLDIILHDNLVGDEILAYAKSQGVECISVGKKKGSHSISQDAINELILAHAKQGKCVGRLKGGDPIIFARVHEEVSFLRQNGVEVELISGISSSLAAPLFGGILLTLREVSSGVMIVSAHLKHTIFDASWLEILKSGDKTLVVLMAHSFALKITQKALALGIDLSIPAAFISRVDYEDQKTIVGNLASLEAMAKMCERPAILVIGNVVAKSECMPFVGQKIHI
ncbi:MAG: uroporphyrinogen-III C-methyltransferase [Campylobacter sp.]|nr:uroporphyrinogen-III C-methyltransferase [Campylobacter sp.]